MALKICAVTGSRADWGLLRSPLRLLRDDPEFELQLAVTGMHLSPAFGRTVEEIAAEGFAVDAEVPTLEAGDDAVAVAEALGRGVLGFAPALRRLAPDLLLVPGDRYEILAAVEAALIARIPIAHIAGGDVTEGAFDDAIRHAISKMAQIHFATNQAAAARLHQMGEAPEHVIVSGSPALDAIAELPPVKREEAFRDLGLAPRPRNFLVTFHPATLEPTPAGAQFRELLGALDELGSEAGLILTGSNADTEGRALGRLAEAYAAKRDNAVFHSSLGQKRYLGVMRHVDAVIGNSSSGLYEAPSFKIPTVNIGSRQEGRLKAASVIDCAPEREAIKGAIERALTLDCSAVLNPYGDGHAGERIVAALKRIGEPAKLLRKSFRSLGPS
ncbi:MAG: UDP-N-acetylglucosamine 2-epimerase [Kiloniellales bacterium]